MLKSDECHRKYGEGWVGGDSSIKFVTKNVNCRGCNRGEEMSQAESTVLYINEKCDLISWCI